MRGAVVAAVLLVAGATAAATIALGAPPQEAPGGSLRELALNEVNSGEVVASGRTAAGRWVLRYRSADGKHCLDFMAPLNDEPTTSCGFDIPNTTRLAVSGFLRPKEDSFYLYGLTTPEATEVRALGEDGITAAVQTVRATRNLRAYVIVRPPVDNVLALEARTTTGQLVQRVDLPRPGPTNTP